MKVKKTISKILTNKWVLNVISFLALFNVIGYMIMGKFNSVVFFLILAVLVRNFSKNMIIVLGTPLIIVNLFSMKNGTFEGMENKTDGDSDNKKIDTKKATTIQQKKNDGTAIMPGTEASDSDVVSADVAKKEDFEVGRRKNGSSKIDYASTIEDAYDDLNKILGSDGIKRLTDDTQGLMKQQMQLAESMKGMAPLVEQMMPMINQMKGMMNSLDSDNSLGGVMDIAKKLSGTKKSS